MVPSFEGPNPHPHLPRDAIANNKLVARQNVAGNSVLIPTLYVGINPRQPISTVFGITLGVVLGITLVIMIMWWAMYQQAEGNVVEERHVDIGHRRRPSQSYTIEEVRRTHSPRRRDIEIVEERSSPSVVFRSNSRRRSRDEENVVVYEESESTEPVRRPSRRASSRKSGYRHVDPDRLGGGDHPRRSVSRRYS
jgi:hypothetical protein